MSGLELDCLNVRAWCTLIALGALSMQACNVPETHPPADAQVEASQPDASVEAPTKPRASLRRQLVDSRSRALELDQLQALGYVDGTYDPAYEDANVLVHIENRAQPGYNFYSSRKARGARLIDMSGRVVHRWQTTEKGAWQHSELLPNGDVLVIVKDRRLTRYDKESRRQWSVSGRFHHDLWIQGDEIYVLARRSKVVESIHPKANTLVDVVQVRALESGELKRELSILDALLSSPYRFLLPKLPEDMKPKSGRSLDVLHTNHVEVFDGTLESVHPMYAAGNILISMRNINAIAVLQPDLEIAWIWGPTNLTFQHHPTVMKNGHILVFDNGTERSRILEIDPADDNAIVWSYRPKSDFFSATRGSNQRLANGNTLITESDRGYVFEVTPSGRIVWKFANPVVNRRKEREAIWRMTRVDPETLTFLTP